jgi:hypothetical protein
MLALLLESIGGKVVRLSVEPIHLAHFTPLLIFWEFGSPIIALTKNLKMSPPCGLNGSSYRNSRGI